MVKSIYCIYIRLIMGMIFLVTSLQGLNPKKEISQYNLDLYSTENGLPQVSVLTISQTRDGYLWMGTYDGLARFDGVRFDVFNKHNVPAMKNNSINVLYRDRRERLWIGTPSGLLCFDKGEFHCYTKADGLIGEFILSIIEDPVGRLWVGSTKGLSLFSEKGFISHTVADGLVHSYISVLECDKEGGLWIGTFGGLCRLKDDKFTIYSLADGLPSKDIRALRCDFKNTLWVGCSGGGLAAFKDGKFRVYGERDGVFSNDIRAIYEDRFGIIWVGTNKKGLYRFKEGLFTSLPLKHGLLNSSVRSFYEDREGSLWVGTKEGLYRLKDEKFVVYNSRKGLPADAVRTVFQDRRGDIWLGTVGGGISRFRNGRFKNFGIEDGLKNNSVWTIAEGKDNTIWFGTYGGGLHRINTENDNIRVLTTKDGLANNIIRVVFVDDEGKVWVGSNGGGVDVMANGKISNYNSKNGLSDDFVYTIAQWQGAMWIGTYGAGLNRLKDGEFTHYGLKDGLTDAAVWALYPDSSGSLWIGTNGGGLHRLKNGKFTRFSMAHGLCSDLTFKIMEDGLGFLWMNSNRGIYKVALDELEKVAQGSLDKVFCFSYGREEGIKYTESSGPAQPAGCRTTDGKLWFPGVKGIIVMDPGSTKKNEIAPPVVIENVSIDNTNQPLGTTCEAPPGKGNLEIKYTGLSFLLPNKVLFKYKLEGFDDDWVNVGTRRTAYYTNIPPGDYKFSVIACNNDGLWNYQGDSFRFTLKPHFYQQKIFYFALPALALLIAMAFYRLRVHNLKTREKRLQKMVEERTAELNRKNEQLKTEIGQRSKAEKEKEKLIDELRDALAKIKTLTGLIPICSKCKKIRDDKGYWQQVDVYIVKHSEVDFSHSLCPDCLDYLYPNISERMKKAMKEE